MHLLIVQDYLRGGGTETQSVYLANQFHAAGMRVTLMSFRPEGVLRPQLKLPQEEQVILQPFDSRINLWSPGLKAQVKALQPDVVLLMGFVANEKGAALKSAWPACKLIASVRTGRTLSGAYKKTLKAADRVVVNAQWTLDQLVADKRVPKEKLVLIDNSLTRQWDFESVESERTRMRRELGIDEETILLINVAGFRPKKGQDALIRMLHEYRTRQKWKLIFLGAGNELQKCTQIVDTLNMKEQIEFMGFQADPFRYLAAADIMVTTSQRDAQPNALVEAQCVGLPIVAYDFAGIKECFVPNQSGYLVPLNEKERFLKQLDTLMEDTDLRKQMGDFGQHWARAKFDATRNRRSYLTLLEKV